MPSDDDEYWGRVHTQLLGNNFQGHRDFYKDRKGDYFASYPPLYQDLTEKQKRHVRRFYQSLDASQKAQIEGKMEISIAGGYQTFQSSDAVPLTKRLAAEIFLDRLKIYWEEGMVGLYFLVGALGAVLQIVTYFCALIPSGALDSKSANLCLLYSGILLFIFTIWGFIHSTTRSE